FAVCIEGFQKYHPIIFSSRSFANHIEKKNPGKAEAPLSLTFCQLTDHEEKTVYLRLRNSAAGRISRKANIPVPEAEHPPPDAAGASMNTT
ncbi:MAG: hypothetical protein PHP80_09650, partial [Synergistaceae bacterium]|nr:hypothetical protein [Synergistaceae bacterium]